MSIAIVLVGILMFVYYLFRTGAFIQIDGEILVPMREDNVQGIYKISLQEDRKELYFVNAEYETQLKSQYGYLHSTYKYPFIQGDKFFCVGLFITNELNRPQDRISVLFMGDVKNPMGNKIHIIMQTPGDIEYTVRTKTGETFYYTKEIKNERGIYKYEVQTQKETLLLKLLYKAQLFLTNDDELIYSKSEDRKDTEGKKYIRNRKFSLLKYCSDKEDELLVEDAAYPTWYEKGESILSYNFEEKASYVYHLPTKKKVKTSGEQPWESSPLVSPDKKHLITVEHAPINFYFLTINHYIVKSGSKQKRELQSIPVETFYSKSVMCWLDDEN